MMLRERFPAGDEPCGATIARVAGYCECGGGLTTHRHARREGFAHSVKESYSECSAWSAASVTCGNARKPCEIEALAP